MRKTKSFLFTASVALAILFTFSCTSGIDDDGPSGGGSGGGGSNDGAGVIGGGVGVGASDAPTGVTITSISWDMAFIEWNNMPGVNYYNVYCSTSQYGAKDICESYWMLNSTVITGLSPNTTYYFWVTALRGSYGTQESGFSAAAYGTTGSTPTITPPQGGGTSNGTLTISGYPYTAASTYGVYVYNVNPASIAQANNLTNIGSGSMSAGGEVTWIKTPYDGSHTVVVYRRTGSSASSLETYYYKATGVAFANGSGSVSWSRFSQMN